MLEADFAPYDYRQLPDALGKRWLVHGDSITQGANVSLPTMTWVDLVARRLGLAATNLGIGGHGKAEPAMAADIAARRRGTDPPARLAAQRPHPHRRPRRDRIR